MTVGSAKWIIRDSCVFLLALIPSLLLFYSAKLGNGGLGFLESIKKDILVMVLGEKGILNLLCAESKLI